MWRTYNIILTVVFTLIYSGRYRVCYTTELISTYAKVAHWGATVAPDSPGKGRSNGQTLWTHRSDINVRGGQNIKRTQPVTYYYSIKAPSSKVDKMKQETLPYKGEVQERFNPRPYFDFVFDDPPRQNQRPNPTKSDTKQTKTSQNKPKQPAIVYGAPPDSLPSFNTVPKPPTDAYSSPFNSYNPPDTKPNDSKDNALTAFDYPPNNDIPPSPLLSSFNNPDDDDDKKPPPPPLISYGSPTAAPTPTKGPLLDSYIPSNFEQTIQSPTDMYGPPDVSSLQVPKDLNKPNSDAKLPSNGNFQSGYDFHPPLVETVTQSVSPSTKKPDNGYFALSPPNDNSESSYYMPQMKPMSENGNDQQMPLTGNGGAMMGGDENNQPPSQNYGPAITPTVQPPEPAQPPYFDHPSMDHDYHPQRPAAVSMAEGDLSPPPAKVPYGKIPEYLEHEPNHHDFYNFDHHNVYHEVHTTTTTTTEAPRAGHYSYYYLGRKLWYIPLYFSVYFIVYVTALILKSIARHKIQFSHNFDKSRASRQLDIDSVNKTVTNAIDKIEKLYM